MYLLDTNICIFAMKNKFPPLTERLFEIHPSEICVSSETTFNGYNVKSSSHISI